MIRAHNSRRWAYAAASVSALTALAAVIALASRAPLSSSTPVDAASASAPITALVFILIAVGAVMAGALIALMWSGRRRKDDEPEREVEPPEVPWYWKLFALLILLALVAALVAAALLGSRPAMPVPILGPGLPGTRLAPPPRPGSNGFVVPSWLPWTALAIAVVAIAAGVAFLVFRSKATPDDSVDRTTARAAVQAAIDALDTGRDTRAAVIAAYAAMERTLADHGAPRSPAEAPREFLLRVLLAGRATEREAGTLTGLFEEARYSTHPIPDQARGIASSALGSLRARLQANESG